MNYQYVLELSMLCILHFGSSLGIFPQSEEFTDNACSGLFRKSATGSPETAAKAVGGLRSFSKSYEARQAN
jgi:hypothetical protein